MPTPGQISPDALIAFEVGERHGFGHQVSGAMFRAFNGNRFGQISHAYYEANPPIFAETATCHGFS